MGARRAAGRALTPNTLRRFQVLQLMLAMAGVALAPRAAIAQRPAAATAEEGVFELSAEGLPSASIPVLVYSSGRYLLPLRATLEPLGIPFTVRMDSGIVRVSRPGGVGVATLHFGAGRPTIEGVTHAPLDSADLVVRDTEVFLSAPRLAELSESTVDVDLSNLTVRVSRPQDFPARLHSDVVAKRQRALRRRMSNAGHAEVPFDARTGFGVVEWSLGGPATPVGLPQQLDTRVGLGLLGGMLKTHVALSRPEGVPATSNADGSYERVFPTAKWVRQLEVGDVFAGGSLARFMRGVTITNAPFARGLDFGELQFSQPLPPGWEVELYEGDQLVGYRDASSSSSMAPVPVQYGTTPLRVRLYGPAGERVESQVTYVIPVEQLAAGTFQYSAGVGRCAQHQCDEVAYLDLRRGMTSKLTLLGGVDDTRDSTERVVRPYVGASFLPSPGWVASLQGRQRGYLRGAVSNQGEGTVTGSLAAGVNAPGEGGTSVTGVQSSSWFVQSGVNLRGIVPTLGDRSLSLGARAQGEAGGPVRWSVSGTAPVRYGLVTAAVETDPRAQLGGRDGPVLRVAPTLAMANGVWQRLGSPTMALQAITDGHSIPEWEANVSVQPKLGFVSLALRKPAGLSELQLSLGASLTLARTRLVSHVVGTPQKLGGGYSLTGADAFGSRGRVLPLEFGGLGLSGVEGRVFRDVNSNGVFDEGDEPVPNAMVAVGGLRSHTDSSGRFAQWNVLPYEPMHVELDSISVEDPAWIPTLVGKWLRPPPQMFTRVDFALTRTREIVGQVVSAPKMPLPAGVSLVLRDSATGGKYETRTFSDGGFYFSRVRAGRYVLSMSDASVAALGAVAPAPIAVDVMGKGDEAIEVAPIVLAPKVVAPAVLAEPAAVVGEPAAVVVAPAAKAPEGPVKAAVGGRAPVGRARVARPAKRIGKATPKRRATAKPAVAPVAKGKVNAKRAAAMRGRARKQSSRN